ncbi:MAG: LysR family transcriptional regulator [Methyloligellaceae bacterium]
MDVTHARTFQAVSDSGSFVEAAKRLNVTQSTVSARIKALEDLVGQRLFERSKSGAFLTPAGRQFHRHALAMIRVWEHARLDVALAEEHRDHLAVGGQFSLWDGFLLDWVAILRDAMPDIAVTARLGMSRQHLEDLAEGTLDIAVVYRPEIRAGMVLEHLFDEELVLVTSGDQGTPRPGENYVFVNWGEDFQADHALAYPELQHTGLRLDLGTLGISYLLERRASGYFPARITRPLIAEGRLSLIEKAPRFVYPVYAVYPEDRNEDDFNPILDLLRAKVAAL